MPLLIACLLLWVALGCDSGMVGPVYARWLKVEMLLQRYYISLLRWVGKWQMGTELPFWACVLPWCPGMWKQQRPLQPCLGDPVPARWESCLARGCRPQPRVPSCWCQVPKERLCLHRSFLIGSCRCWPLAHRVSFLGQWAESICHVPIGESCLCYKLLARWEMMCGCIWLPKIPMWSV